MSTHETQGKSGPRRFVATPAEDGWPLERVLAARLGESRRGARRLLDARRVFVNDRRVWMARHRVQAGDRIELYAGPASAESACGRILHEAADALVVDKPARVVSTGPGGVDDRWSLRRGGEPLRAIHRLDRDTTGCLILARTPEAAARFVEWFRAGRVVKTYDAIVAGRFPAGRRDIRERVDGRPAWSRVWRVVAGAVASWVRVWIPTGRTHQIRRHLLAIGHPIVGDATYGASRALPPELRAAPRQMLHATEIRFPDGGGGEVVVRSPLPSDFVAELRRFGLDRGVRLRSCAET